MKLCVAFLTFSIRHYIMLKDWYFNVLNVKISCCGNKTHFVHSLFIFNCFLINSQYNLTIRNVFQVFFIKFFIGELDATVNAVLCISFLLLLKNYDMRVLILGSSDTVIHLPKLCMHRLLTLTV